jgi:hypothetical protein
LDSAEKRQREGREKEEKVRVTRTKGKEEARRWKRQTRKKKEQRYLNRETSVPALLAPHKEIWHPDKRS